MAPSPSKGRKAHNYAADASDSAQAERDIQAKIDATDHPRKPNDSAPQTGARKYPVPPLPNSIKPSRARKQILTRYRCSMRPTTLALKN
jgi:hypothetical protein